MRPTSQIRRIGSARTMNSTLNTLWPQTMHIWSRPCMQSVWTMPSQHGPYLGPYDGHGEALRPVALPKMLDLIEATYVYGVLELPEGRFVGCCLIVSRTGKDKWLSFYIPTGMLALSMYPKVWHGPLSLIQARIRVEPLVRS